MREEGREVMADSLQVPLLKNWPQKNRMLRLWSHKDFMAESKMLWRIAGPAIFIRLATYATNVVTQAFVGHLGDVELAAITISSSVLMGFSFGLLLGMGSAVETMCGQAFGAKKYDQLGIYLQRAWIVLLLVATISVPVFIWATPLLKLAGQSEEVAQLSGKLALWMIPMLYCYALILPMQTFLQSQIKNYVLAWLTGVSLLLHVVLTWLLVTKLNMGVVGAVLALDFSTWFPVLAQFIYITCGGCPLSWKGFSMAAFNDLGYFLRLSFASGVMLCLELWYYQVLILLTGLLQNVDLAVDALSICMNVNNIQVMISAGFLAGTGVRVANELGSGNGKGAKFAVIVAVVTSLAIGFVFWVLILVFRNDYALIFTSSLKIRKAVSQLAYLLAFTILLNSVQPVLSGVAVGSGWQSTVAYINIGCYYVVGLPFGILLGWPFNLHVQGIWAGMIGGTAAQTMILGFITYRCDWDKEASQAVERVNGWAASPNSKENEENMPSLSC